ncbi:conserved Plasmodium protein, unknown function [Plasmodium ovale wallikeri]|uniref:SSD domain-containing protein n=2 Tax=Plasmodium ovale TaxID=36330 RepID=A0A1C3KW92_PLAOA|nr:conserved Plasmodium protein, unknown function [Plasmodium ovale wallikeri]SBT78476.1 conserved Plasmodium protein, unknown function [Plasmodium ovale]
MDADTFDCDKNSEGIRKNIARVARVDELSCGENDCTISTEHHVGVEENKAENGNNLVYCSKQYLEEKEEKSRVNNSRYSNLEERKRKNRKNIFHILCKKWVKCTMGRPSCIFLSLVVGYTICLVVCFSFYNSLFEETEEMKPTFYGSFWKNVRENQHLKINVNKTSDVITQSNDQMGKSVENFFKFYKKEKTVSLLFYMNKQEDKKGMLQYDILKDIFFLLQFFKQIEVEKNIIWNDICKKFDIPFNGEKCFVLGLFAMSEVQNGQYDSAKNWNDYFSKLLKQEETFVKIFFSNAINFLPNFLYYPHVYDKTSQHLDNIISDIGKNIESLLFVFNIDEYVDDSLLNVWYNTLNMYIKEINEKKITHVHINNPDGTSFLHDLYDSRTWNIAVMNEKIVEENEILSIHVGLKSNFLFVILSFIFIICYINSISSNTLQLKDKVVLLLSIYSLTFFSFCTSFFFHLSFGISVLRICLLNYFVLFFLSFLFLCINVFYFKEYTIICSKMVGSKTDRKGHNYEKVTNMQKVHIRAAYKSLFFVGKFLFILLCIYFVGYICTYTIVKKFCMNSLFCILSLFFFYAIFFNNIFSCLFYKNRESLYWLSGDQKDHIIELEKWGEKPMVHFSGKRTKNTNHGKIIHTCAYISAKPNEKLNVTEQDGRDEHNSINEGAEEKNGQMINVNGIDLAYDREDLESVHYKDEGLPSGETKQKNAIPCSNSHRKRFVPLFVFFLLLCVSLFLCIFITNREMLDVYRYMSKNSEMRKFVETFEKKAGYVIEPAYLVLPASDQFDYEKEENRKGIIELVEKLKWEGCIDEPVISWVHAFELIKNDCLNITPLDEQYVLDDHVEDCNEFVLQKENKDAYLDKLREIFCENKRAECDTFYKIVYEWFKYKEDGISNGYLFEIKTFFQDKISRLLPRFYTFSPHFFFQNYVQMDDAGNIRSSRVGFMIRNYAKNYEKNEANFSKIKSIIKKSNIKDAYFYSETYVLYNQAKTFLHEYKVMLIFYFFVYLLSLYIFNAVAVLIIFQFWLCNNLSVIYLTHTFSVNTDAITIILLKISSVLSLSHYLYSTLFFKKVIAEKINLVASIKQSCPFFLFLVLYLVTFNMSDYVSNVLRLLIMSHGLWFLFYYLTIFFMHKIYVSNTLKGE